MQGSDAAARFCVRHRCIAPMPMPVPLPFPAALFGGTVGPAGQTYSTTMAAAAMAADRLRQQRGGGAAQAAAAAVTRVPVSTVPVLTKLMATASFAPLLQQVGEGRGEERGDAAQDPCPSNAAGGGREGGG